MKQSGQQYRRISLDANYQLESGVAQKWPQINFLKLISDLNWEQNALTNQRQIQTFIQYCDSVLNNSVKTDGFIQMYYLSLGLLSMNQCPLFDWLTRI